MLIALHVNLNQLTYDTRVTTATLFTKSLEEIFLRLLVVPAQPILETVQEGTIGFFDLSHFVEESRNPHSCECLTLQEPHMSYGALVQKTLAQQHPIRKHHDIGILPLLVIQPFNCLYENRWQHHMIWQLTTRAQTLLHREYIVRNVRRLILIRRNKIRNMPSNRPIKLTRQSKSVPANVIPNNFIYPKILGIDTKTFTDPRRN